MRTRSLAGNANGHGAQCRVAAPAVLVLAVSFLASVGLVAALASGLVFLGFLTAAPRTPTDTAFTGIFVFYAFTVVFPTMLFVAWSKGAGQIGPKATRRTSDQPTSLRVSIVIPAFNEEAHIVEAVAAARAQHHPACEVIVVDDGSEDRTRDLAEKAGARVCRLPENRGKAEAANAGLALASGEIVVCSDADTVLHPDALRHLLVDFVDPAVGAVAGRVDIAQSGAFLGDLQGVEYTYGQQVIKRAQSGSRCPLAVLPGPLMAVRRSVFAEIGGLSTRTLTEDFDATIEVVKAGYDVRYAPGAVARTIGPRSWAALHRQRLRWSRGMFQTLAAHRGMLLDPRYGLFSMFWLPYYLVSGFCSLALDGLLLALLAGLLIWRAPVRSRPSASSFRC